MGLTEQENVAPGGSKPSGLSESILSILREDVASLQLTLEGEGFDEDTARTCLKKLVAHASELGDPEEASDMLIAVLESLKLLSTNTSVDNDYIVSILFKTLVELGEEDTKVYEVSAQLLVASNNEVKIALSKLQGCMHKGKQTTDQHTAARDDLEMSKVLRLTAKMRIATMADRAADRAAQGELKATHDLEVTNAKAEAAAAKALSVDQSKQTEDWTAKVLALCSGMVKSPAHSFIPYNWAYRGCSSCGAVCAPNSAFDPPGSTPSPAPPPSRERRGSGRGLPGHTSTGLACTLSPRPRGHGRVMSSHRNKVPAVRLYSV